MIKGIAPLRGGLRPRLLGESGMGSRIRLLRDYGVLASALGLIAVLAVISPPFRTVTNQLNLLDQWSVIGIIACGATICLIAGGFDLSVDAIYALSGVIAAWLAVNTGSPVLAIAIGIASGVGMGLFNGLLVTVGRINPFVATIASSVVFLGIAALITQGTVISVSTPGFSAPGLARFGSLTLVAIVFVAFAIVTAVLLSRTVLGRSFYAVGGNYEAARYAGIRVRAVQIGAYVISGLAASLAGVLMASRNTSAQADLRTDLAFQAITAIVIGGVSIYGGIGTIPRALAGVLILALIGNGFNLLLVDPAYQKVLLGVIIVLAVAVDAWSRRAPS